jgi:maltose/moltooligosaccharide transporter
MSVAVKQQKPRLSFWQIWNMSFGFFGIQVGLALQNANMSRVFRTLGAEEDKLAILWLAAPFTGLVVQPIIGYMSDRTWNGLGRRKPYFLTGAVLASLALLVVPNASALWIAAGLLWILDASINVSMEPFRALVADMLPDEQRTSGFAIQSFFIGTGSVLASALPWMLHNFFGIRNEPTAGEMVPPNVAIAFYMGAAMFITAIIWTIVKTKEYPPKEFKTYNNETEQEHISEGFDEIVKDFLRMPSKMRQLGVVQFFSWFGLFALWIYTSSAVARQIYNTTDAHSKAFNEAGDWVGVGFSVYNGVAAIFAFLLPVLAAKVGRKALHAICLLAGGIGLASVYFVTDKYLFLLSMSGVGIAWASILSMPYAMLAGAIPTRKMGVYMGFFNFFIVIPQILAATVLGFMVKNYFNNNSVFALVLGGVLMFIAAAFTMTVDEKN